MTFGASRFVAVSAAVESVVAEMKSDICFRFYMIKRMIFIQKSRLHVVVCMLLLLAGSFGGAWCFQTGSEPEHIELTVLDCHSVPTTCYRSGSSEGEKDKTPEPSNCNECFDLSFDELLSTRLQGRNADFVSLPAVAHYQPLLYLSTAVQPSFPSPYISDLLAQTFLSTHRSIQTTVLII